MRRISSRKELVGELTQNGWELVRSTKHDIFSNGKEKISIPKQHSNNFSIFLAQRILKQAGINIR